MDPQEATLFAALGRQARWHPDRVAVVHGGQRWTYAQWEAEVRSIARALLAAGIAPGDRIAMLAPSGAPFWSTFLATAAIGGIWVGLGLRNRLEELRHAVSDASPRVIIAVPSLEGRDYRADLAALGEIEAVEQVILLDQNWEAFVARGAGVPDSDLDAALARVSARDPALIVYTSGSTGRPKGAILSHRGLVEGSRAQPAVRAIPAPVVSCAFPINHVAAVGDTCCATMVAGGTIVLCDRFDPAEQLALVEREGLNVLAGVPTMLQMILAQPALASTDLGSLRLIAWGGAALSRPTIDALRPICPTMVCVYGMTETTANCAATDLDADAATQAECIGRALPGYEIRIADGGDRPVQGQDVGEIQVRSPCNMLGYWRDPAATDAAFTADGWLRTGDLGFTRADGNIVLTGRRSDMFKSGGFNIYPREVEMVLEAHPDVAMVVVVGTPDPVYQEVGTAFVLANGSDAHPHALRRHARGHLANYKVPKHIHLCETLPFLANGKVDRASLKARAASLAEGS